jgi:hypothetical protein
MRSRTVPALKLRVSGAPPGLSASPLDQKQISATASTGFTAALRKRIQAYATRKR